MGRAYLRQPGCLVQRNSARIILAFLLGLLVLCVSIKSNKFDAQLASWIQQSSRVQAELQYVNQALGEGTGSSSQLLIQTANGQKQRLDSNALTVEAFMVHLEAMAIATHVTVDLFDVTWSLKELCFRPTLPTIEGFQISSLLDRIMPCAIKTPLDCFWEGAKLHGPGEIGGPSSVGLKRWTALDPVASVEQMQRLHPHASFDYVALLDWMRRVGISHGYQLKPCLDPTDPNCPDSAPNKKSNKPPNIGAQLTGGCRGVAESQMHWREEELVGGAIKNRSGFIVKAAAIQSSIPLMGEQDMYDYWRKTEQTQDINNWSPEKAKLILETWQQKFKQELAQFTHSSSSSSQKIHAMTSKSMLEPINIKLLLDGTSFAISFALMTIVTCISMPAFKINVGHLKEKAVECDDEMRKSGPIAVVKERTNLYISRFRLTLLALICSFIVGLTFVASIGLSTSMDLLFNMATTQILPPLALYYGFNQFSTIVNIYSQKFASIAIDQLTVVCMNELFPIIMIESTTYSIALLVTTIFPVPATRAFALQAITHILTQTLVAILLIPAILTFFLKRHRTFFEGRSEFSHSSSSSMNKKQLVTTKGTNYCKGKKCAKQVASDEDDESEVDEIFSRIQDDLKNIQADSRNNTPTDLNFSAHLAPDGGLHTSFNLSRATTPTLSVNKDLILDPTTLPDLIASSTKPIMAPTSKQELHEEGRKSESSCEQLKDVKETQKDVEDTSKSIVKEESRSKLCKIYAKGLTANRFVQATVCLIQLVALVLLLPQASKVKYGLQLKDIVAHGTEEYESFSAQEKYFPVYNVFAITKGNFDYPTNQRLLHEFHKAIEQVDGIVKESENGPKFWLVAFRDWLLEIQRKFDSDKRKALISVEGWTPDASEASKLAYKLLAQTGRVDNPIDKNQVDTGRLVDANGIINPKAFYYYLTAWISCDAFVYATSEANFKPEPKFMNDNPDNLKIEKARPLVYAQIPFLLKLSANHESVKTISEIRSISQAFEQLNLPNFPTGIPFIFWDQFVNLDLLMFTAIAIGIISIFIVILLMTHDPNTAAIITLPILLTIIELYALIGYLSIPFNNILAVLLVSSIGISIVQTVHYTTYFISNNGDLMTRTSEALQNRSRIVITSLLLFFLCVIVFHYSKIDFMIKYSYLIFCLFLLNSFNSLLLTPVILSIFGSDYKLGLFSEEKEIYKTIKNCKKVRRHQDKSGKVRIRASSSSSSRSGSSSGGKKRSYPRKIQSEISLSTISEEPQSEAHDYRIDFSIRCY